MTKNPLRRDIQGLRALAVLGVMLFHFNAEWLPGGFVGVDIFFVISGFIITNLIFNDQKRFSWLDFYWGRIRRIVPAYLATLALTTTVAAIIFVPSDFGNYWQSLKSALLFASNWHFTNFGDYFAPSSSELPLLHMWSLAIEMQFYILLPFVLLFVPRHRLSKVCLFGIFSGFFSVFYWAHSHGADASWYFSLWVRVPEFLLGVYLASTGAQAKSLRLSIVLGMVGIVLITMGFLVCQKENFFYGNVLLPCLGATLVIASRGAGMPWLSGRHLVWLGGLSFSLYLWHWPVLAFMRYVLQEHSLTLANAVVFLGITGFLSGISWRFIELPGRTMVLQRSQLSPRAGAVLVSALTPLLFAKQVNATFVAPLDVSLTRYADSDLICHGKIVGNCIRGHERIKPTTLVIGDSHAAELNLFFDEIGRSAGNSFKVVTASSCIPIKNFDVDRISDWARKDCQAQIGHVKQLLPEFKTVVVAGMWSYQLKSKAFVQAFNAFLTESRKNGQRIIVLAQLPMLSGNPVRSHRHGRFGIPPQLLKMSIVDSANEQLDKILKPYSNVDYKNFSDANLFVELPFYAGQLIYMDAHHLNEVGAVRYAQIAGPQLQNLDKYEVQYK